MKKTYQAPALKDMDLNEELELLTVSANIEGTQANEAALSREMVWDDEE